MAFYETWPMHNMVPDHEVFNNDYLYGDDLYRGEAFNEFGVQVAPSLLSAIDSKQKSMAHLNVGRKKFFINWNTDRLMHIRACKYSGMSATYVLFTDDQCCCAVPSPQDWTELQRMTKEIRKLKRSKKETKMFIPDVDRKIQYHQQQIDKLEAERIEAEEKKAKWGTDEDYAIETVIFFERNFGRNFKYTYAAVKTKSGQARKWYITGQNAYPLTWEELVERHLDHAVAEGLPVYIASGWEQLA
jgi:hypothetical protein